MAEQERSIEREPERFDEGTVSSETLNSSLQEESFSEAKCQSGAASKSESQNPGSAPKELVFADPFKSAMGTGDGPRLRTALPAPAPVDLKPAAEKAQDGPRTVMAVVAVPEKAEVKPNVSGAESDGFKRPESEKLSKEAKARQLGVKQFSQWLNTNFELLDGDKDGTLTEKEAATAITDASKANGESAPYVNALYNTLDTLAAELEGAGSKGLSKTGLDALSKLADNKDFFRKGERALAVKDLEKVMTHLDPNHNSYFTPAENLQAQKREDLSPQQLQALKDLHAFQNHKINKDYGKVDKDENGQDLIQQDAGGGAIMMTPRNRMGDLQSHDLGNYASTLERVTENISYSLQHSQDRLEAGKQDPGRISQGTDGSCFFLSPLNAMKDYNPSIMDKMIKDNGDGTQTVTFPGKPNEAITVKTPTDAEMAGWANGKQAAILEKAFSEYYVKNIASQKELSDSQQEKLNSPVPAARILGGNTADAFKLLTGKDATVKDLEATSEADLRKIMTDAEKNKFGVAVDSSYYKLDSGIVTSHSYKAKYDSASDTVTLENPVKPGRPNENTSSYPYEPFKVDRSALDGKDDGIFKMSLADFQKKFARISYVPK